MTAKSNKTISINSLKIMISLLVLTMMTIFSSAKSHAEVNLAEVFITDTGISVSSTSAQVLSLHLRISDSFGNMVFDQYSKGETLFWNVSSSSHDRLYSWEAKASTIQVGRQRNSAAQQLPAPLPWITSGNFTIDNNSILSQDKQELTLLDTILQTTGSLVKTSWNFILPSAHAQVFAEDVIVQGSECVGVDCEAAPAFGFDTLILKENNLRIFFDDSTAPGSFPANDWRININDSANGGANYFGIEDSTAGRMIFRVEAGAPANSLTVDAQGDVGIGTAAAVVKLHMVTGNSPAIRLEQDGSSGFTPQSWDVAGNEANFFVRDVTNGSKLPFKIKPNTPSNTLFLNTDGNVGIGTSAPDSTLQIKETNTGKATLFKISTATDAVFSVAQSGDTTILGNLDVGSSRNLKHNIHEVTGDEALEALDHLSPVHFSYRSSPDVHSLGFIAEDVPEIVATHERKTLRPMDMVALLTKVTQEQQKAIEMLSAQLKILEKQVILNNN